MSEREWQHAGLYPSKKRAEDYAQYLSKDGMEVKIVEKTFYDVWARLKQ
jgi:hypothetical protein